MKLKLQKEVVFIVYNVLVLLKEIKQNKNTTANWSQLTTHVSSI